jgi:uncharacterized protein YbcI
LGRGPTDVRSQIVNRDMILVRLRGILTPAEKKLAETPEGRDLIKEMRRQLFESSRGILEKIVESVIGCKLISMHTDMSTKTDERIVVFVVDQDLDSICPASKGK